VIILSNRQKLHLHLSALSLFAHHNLPELTKDGSKLITEIELLIEGSDAVTMGPMRILLDHVKENFEKIITQGGHGQHGKMMSSACRSIQDSLKV
jgi:hypothetical protein